MKRALLCVVCTLAVGFTAANVQASPIFLSHGDASYVGIINDGIPSSEALELAYLNALLELPVGETGTYVGPTSTEALSREYSSVAYLPPVGSYIGKYADADSEDLGPLPDGCTIGDCAGFTPFTNLGGTYYIIGKYDQTTAGSLVFLVDVPAGETVYLPSAYNDRGLSHASLFRVPDGGSTLMLLGGALMGLAAVRRKILP